MLYVESFPFSNFRLFVVTSLRENNKKEVLISLERYTEYNKTLGRGLD